MKTEVDNIIGKRMKEVRGLMSQRQAAACVGIKPQGWNVYENGQSLPGAQVIKNICQYFNVSADWLLGLGAVREVSRGVIQSQSPVRSSKTTRGSDETALRAELAALKRRIDALEKSQSHPSFACA